MRRLLAALLLLATAGLAPVAGAQRTARLPTGTLAGIVIDSTGRPIAGVTLQVLGTAAVAQSGDSGDFRLAEVPVGPRMLQLRRLGFAPLTAQVVVAEGTNDELEIVLDAVATELAPVAVQGTRAMRDVGRIGASSFVERQRMGFGTFFTREDIEKRRPWRVADIIRHARGLRVEPAPGNKVRIVTMRGLTSIEQPPCVTKLMVDAVPVPQDQINEMVVDHVEAVETYAGPATTPPEFGGTSATCGVVVIWTRR